ncbi:MAG: ferrous iron transport protein B [Chitinophagales bacterium]
MKKTSVHKVALIGNPNSGKSSLFNQLTGLNQRIGNFPGVTVDKKTGYFAYQNIDFEITDLPGTYSMYPSALDEQVVIDVLLNKAHINHPETIIYIVDATNLERHLLLLSQLIDLQIPIVVAVNMTDLALKKGINVNIEKLSTIFNVPFIAINARNAVGINLLKDTLVATLSTESKAKSIYQLSTKEEQIASTLTIDDDNSYYKLMLLHHYKKIKFLDTNIKNRIEQHLSNNSFDSLDIQLEEILSRYNQLTPIAQQSIDISLPKSNKLTYKIDSILTHPIIGPILFFLLMLFTFQAIFNWSSYPMDFIDEKMLQLSNFFKTNLSDNFFTSLLTDGIIPGITGVIIFVPQIFILFLLITILEEVGYMARAVFLFDRLMQRFGLNGRSIVALISGGACAIPAIMSTRTINNWKERLITIMVTPLISCSARIPVFAILIAFVIPKGSWLGFNTQALFFMLLYVLGILSALIAAFVFSKILKSSQTSYLMMELPSYKVPYWKNVIQVLLQKLSSFVFGAGKIIFLVSIILWFLASFSTKKGNSTLATYSEQVMQNQTKSKKEKDLMISAKQLEVSFAGKIGKAIEPVIKPLGYDWKIGIALITSFAAREVFVGSIATLYSIEQDASDATIREKLSKAKHQDTQQPVFTVASALSLLLFYLFAMQCMSTLAIVRKETQSWKWPIIQFTYMTVLAYGAAFLAYQVFK